MFIRKVIFFRLIPLASLLLAACTTPPLTRSPSPQWHQHERALQQLTHYQLRGALAYLTDEKKIYARFFWQQYSPDRYRLVLMNPLGSTELELNVQPGEVRFIDSQGKRDVSDNPETMIEKLVGISLPLNPLRQWILGLPDAAKNFTLDDQYRLKQLSYQQNGQTWVVNYQEYHRQTRPTLPRRLELQRGEQRIKVKIDNWVLP